MIKGKARLVKRGQPLAPPALTDDTFLSASLLAEMALPGWDTRGWHGGGECTIRKTQRTRPAHSRMQVVRRAHPSLLR